jgi:hypothetical protein
VHAPVLEAVDMNDARVRCQSSPKELERSELWETAVRRGVRMSELE